jgi:hypothetical protein
VTTAARFKQADVTRAAKGAKAAGIRIGRIEIDARGSIVIEAATMSSTRKGSSWDDVLP